jgi:hypothetical protein
MKMILNHLDDYESRLSVANSHRAYERCMRKLDMGMGEEKDDDILMLRIIIHTGVNAMIVKM